MSVGLRTSDRLWLLSQRLLGRTPLLMTVEGECSPCGVMMRELANRVGDAVFDNERLAGHLLPLDEENGPQAQMFGPVDQRCYSMHFEPGIVSNHASFCDVGDRLARGETLKITMRCNMDTCALDITFYAVANQASFVYDWTEGASCLS